MTATEFRQQHGDPAAWTTADHETYDVLRTNDQHLANTTRICWFCAAETAANTATCGFCGNHADDGPTPAQQSADRLRNLLAPAT